MSLGGFDKESEGFRDPFSFVPILVYFVIDTIISAILFHVDLFFIGFTSICLGSNTTFERF